MNRDPPDYGMVEIGQNTQKSPGDWRIFAVPKTPVKDHLMTLVRKAHDE